MNLSHFTSDIATSEWIDRFIKILGSEDKFWEFTNKQYSLLNGMKVGESLSVEKWCKPENYELFIKIAVCYIQTSKCCYQFNTEYTIIKKQFDAEEVDRQIALLNRKRREKELAANGNGTQSGQRGTSTVSAPEPQVQSS